MNSIRWLETEDKCHVGGVKQLCLNRILELPKGLDHLYLGMWSGIDRTVDWLSLNPAEWIMKRSTPATW